MRAEPSIRCSTADPTYRRMSTVAAFAVVLYGIGLPVTFWYFLHRHGRAIDADQALRKRCEGETAMTNPNISVRRRFRKLYEDFKPEYKYWKLVLIARKLALAIVGILLAGNAALQVHQT